MSVMKWLYHALFNQCILIFLSFFYYKIAIKLLKHQSVIYIYNYYIALKNPLNVLYYVFFFFYFGGETSSRTWRLGFLLALCLGLALGGAGDGTWASHKWIIYWVHWAILTVPEHLFTWTNSSGIAKEVNGHACCQSSSQGGYDSVAAYQRSEGEDWRRF